jgi:hypothetical protein
MIERADNQGKEIEGIRQWMACQELEQASGKARRFIWSTFACVEDVGRAGSTGARGAAQSPNKP